MYIITYKTIYYLFIEKSKSFEIKVRDKNKRTNLGNMYLDNMYNIIIIMANVKLTSFIK